MSPGHLSTQITDHKGVRSGEEKPPHPGPYPELRPLPCEVCGAPLGSHSGFSVKFRKT